MTTSFCYNVGLFRCYTLPYFCKKKLIRNINAVAVDKKINECYHILHLPINSKQDDIRKAFLDLAKKYHPDSGSPEANMDKFVAVENAFRYLTKHKTGSTNEEIEKVVGEIKHIVPQHRQYLSFEGVGHGTPYQRQKQWAQNRAQKAATNVMEHRISKAVASENTLMKKGHFNKKHDIKTKYGFDRLVEDLIQESMSKGEFENLSGIGKPLKDQNNNPYVDFTTHKLNEVLINNGFTPEWIIMTKEIEQDVEFLRKDISNDRKVLGPFPLNDNDQMKWQDICQQYRDFVKTINKKINKYNLIVPLISKQKMYIDIEHILDDILQNGEHSVSKIENNRNKQYVVKDDVITIIFNTLRDMFKVNNENKKISHKEYKD
ncbi:hypothetical protein ACJJTC_010590 [Scirpophaga incertulas]